nr:fimbrillin family protein [uncultured Bacteroides sp.]
MKRLSDLLLIFSILCISGLSGCSHDEDITEQTANFIIDVKTEEFTPQAATRVPLEEGYKTVFQGGEQIGITGVKNGTVYHGMDNVPFTYDATANTWKPTNSSILPQLYYYPDVTYIAYYPYNTGMNGKKSEQEIIDAFTPQTDQSTYAQYTASDLMTSTGIVSGSNGAYTISFKLEHRMSLIIVKAKGKQCVTTSSYEYSTLPFDFSFKLNDTVLPGYESGIGTHCFIVSPADASQKISVSFQSLPSIPVSYETTYTNLAAGKYYSLNFDNEGGIATIRDLQVGDYFYSDGSIMPQEISDPPSKKDCIGLVFNVGKHASDSGTYTDKSGAGMDVHGYVIVAAPNVYSCAWGSQETDRPDGVGTSKNSSDFMGYDNTQKIKAKALTKNPSATATSGLSTDGTDNYPATYYAIFKFEEDCPTPQGSSGWFLPSMGQVQAVYSLKTKLTEKLIKLNKNTLFNDRYSWTSTETGSTGQHCYGYNLNTGRLNPAGKGAGWYSPIAILAF